MFKKKDSIQSHDLDLCFIPNRKTKILIQLTGIDGTIDLLEPSDPLIIGREQNDVLVGASMHMVATNIAADRVWIGTELGWASVLTLSQVSGSSTIATGEKVVMVGR